MTNYLTKSRTLTLPNYDYVTIENVQEEMEVAARKSANFINGNIEIFKSIDYDRVAEIMAANYCPWREDVPVYISRRGNDIWFTIDYMEGEVNDALTISIKAEKVSELDDMIDDDSEEIEYTANKHKQ